ncbi:MAG: hypothetical protein PHE97_07460, partial [Candidatus Omnitrophica bacterium]|nr:hypothetical protein [Candidatus Omnitrophota bacterium]
TAPLWEPFVNEHITYGVQANISDKCELIPHKPGFVRGSTSLSYTANFYILITTCFYIILHSLLNEAKTFRTVGA